MDALFFLDEKWKGAGLLLLAVLLAGCAVPQPPSGGPRDTTPPSLVASMPEAGAVDVTGRTVRLEFSEYVERTSLPQALTITPAVEGRPRFDWGRRAVEITFPASLRDSTTYILSLDTNLRDVHGVALRQPITLAFSTGPTIQRGRLAGRALDALTGDPLANLDVLAYAAPDSVAPHPLPDRPAYRTQTGPDGTFTFEYLRQQPYFVAALRDQNRNFRPDPGEAYGVPPRPALYADSVRADTTGAPWLIARPDTLRPTARQVRSRSPQRHVVRFSEPVRLTALAPDGWLVRDSLRHVPRPVRSVYQPPDEAQQVVLLTDSLPMTPHLLHPSAAVVDTSGNPARPDTLRFVPAAGPDTLRLQFAGFILPPDAPEDTLVVLPPRQQPGLRFNQPVDSTRLRTLVTVRDTTGAARPYSATTDDGTTYRLHLRPPLAPAEAVRLRVDARVTPSDTAATRTFRRISSRQLGSLSGVVEPPAPNSTVLVELYDTTTGDLVDTVTAAPDGTFVVADLPEGTYRFRAFADRNQNRRWDAGRLVPYADAEPVTWTDAPTWRARWETALADTLRLSPR